MLVFGVLALGLPRERGPRGGHGPRAWHCSSLGIGLSLGGPTGYAINPARDLGPRIVHAILPIPGKGSTDWGYSWIPVVGPVIGGVIGALVGDAVFGRWTDAPETSSHRR